MNGKNQMTGRRRCFAFAVLAILISVVAHAQPAPAPFYKMTLRGGDGVEDAAIVATELAATYGGSVASVGDNGSVTMRLDPAVAQALTTDPRVASVTLQSDARPATVAANSETVPWSTGVAYSYDGAGNVRRAGNDVYIYDKVNRLVQSQTNGITRTYEYDRYGNRTKCTQAPGTANQADCQYTYTVDAATNRVNDLSYDAAGNVTQFGVHHYTYDALDAQTRDDVSGGGREYVYDANGERIATRDLATGKWRWTFRDPSGKLLREFSSNTAANGTPTTGWKWEKDYIWRDGVLLATRQLKPGSTAVETYHYHLDHLGTPRRITDDGDHIVGIHDYHAFGPEVSGGQAEPSLALTKFTGHERDISMYEDAQTLDYMHARYSSPMLGRFLSVDPSMDLEKNLPEPQRWNRYAYATNNPIKYFDPDGRDKKIYILQSFAIDSTTYQWGSVEKLASNGYEVDPHRLSSESTYNEYLAKADTTDFVFTFSHAAYTGISDATFFSFDKNRKFDNSAISGAALAAAVNKDTSRPAGIALIGCNTIRPAQDLANRTGVVVVGSRGLVSFANDKKAISVLTAYASKNGRIDQAAIDQVNKAICPSGKCSYRYELALPRTNAK
ncbi:MAG TPA: RHS repeat-associated core domain-containing protein [Thermoanaerobaculia bacterium]|nr:RHS repeat-associated core domain-containing protein [Thermoanaerobaculia bacterium]